VGGGLFIGGLGSGGFPGSEGTCDSIGRFGQSDNGTMEQ
jgi:hypothetical protein